MLIAKITTYILLIEHMVWVLLVLTASGPSISLDSGCSVHENARVVPALEEIDSALPAIDSFPMSARMTLLYDLVENRR